MNINVPWIFNVVALILLLAGAFSPGWMAYKISKGTGFLAEDPGEGTGTIHKGIFYTVGPTTVPLGSVVFLEFQGEVIIGLILCVLATLFSFMYRTGQKGHRFLLAPILLNIFSGFITWIAVGRAYRYIDLLLDLLVLYYTIDRIVPYSLILSGLGGILCFITAIILCVKKYEDSNMAPPASSSGVVFTNAAQPQLNLGYGMQAESQKTGF